MEEEHADDRGKLYIQHSRIDGKGPRDSADSITRPPTVEINESYPHTTNP